MKHAVVMIAILTTTAVALVGCDEATLTQRYGQLLTPASVPGCPKGCVPYVTAQGDHLYLLADRAYGEGYKMYRIMALAENKPILAAITLPNGTLEKGHIIFLPASETNGQIKPEKHWYFGGTGAR